MEREQRNAIGSAAQQIRKLLEREYAEQLDGVFDVRPSGVIAAEPGTHLSAQQCVVRAKIVAAIDYYQARQASPAEAVARFTREAAFTTFNRFVALKVLESRELVQQCISGGEESRGYHEFIGLAPGVAHLGDGLGYRLYIESLFDELSSEVKALFDRRDSASLLWPRHNALEALLDEINNEVLAGVWHEDETIGWFYQFFNSKEERKAMRDASKSGPRNSRELAVLNQFFTPRYVVELLVDNTLARTWSEMHPTTQLLETSDFFVELADERHPRVLKDPRDFRVLDPACGSGHFLLYAFGVLETMYRDAWSNELASGDTSRPSLRDVYSTQSELNLAIPTLILEENLFGIEIDPRAAQIAALALWLRAQRSWRDAGVHASERPRIRRTGVVVAEPMPGDQNMIDEFAGGLDPPLLGTLFRHIANNMTLAGEMGFLLRAEAELEGEIIHAREAFVAQQLQPQTLPGLVAKSGFDGHDFTGIDEDSFFVEAEHRLLQYLTEYASATHGAQSARRRMFAGDAAQGVAFLELLRQRYDVILMNPPFGAGSLKAKKDFEKAYPRTKNDVYAAFVERGIELLVSRGQLGAITSRTGFFLSSFQRWREEIVLDTAPPLVFADLGQGVLDGAMVEVAAYALEAV